MKLYKRWLCCLLASMIFIQPLVSTQAKAANPFEAMIDVMHNAKRRASMKSPDDLSVSNVEQVASEIDWLEHKVETFGTVVPKQPDVWGEARLTKYRQEVEDELSKRLDEFEATLQGSIRRSDQSFLSAALAIDAASGGAAVNTSNLSADQIEKIATAQAEASKAQAEAHTALINSLGVATDGLVAKTDLGGLSLKDSSFDTKTISIEPTVFNNQLDRYLKALNQLRRINEGDDTSDAPGYSLNLVRIPISVLPGKMTRKGYGAEVSLTAKPQITDDLLPTTMRSLIVNDVVNMHSLPVSQQLLNDPYVTEAFVPAFQSADTLAEEWIRVYDAWLKLWVDAIHVKKMLCPTDLKTIQSLQVRYEYYHRIREYISNRLIQIASLEDGTDRYAIEVKLSGDEFSKESSEKYGKLLDHITVRLNYSAAKSWANKILSYYNDNSPLSLLQPQPMQWEIILKWKDAKTAEKPVKVMIPLGMKAPGDYANETISLTPPFSLGKLDEAAISPILDLFAKNELAKSKDKQAELKKMTVLAKLSKDELDTLSKLEVKSLIKLAQLEPVQISKFTRLKVGELQRVTALSSLGLSKLAQLEAEEISRLAQLEIVGLEKSVQQDIANLKRLSQMITGENNLGDDSGSQQKRSTFLLDELGIPSDYITNIQSIDWNKVTKEPENKSGYIDLLATELAKSNQAEQQLPLLKRILAFQMQDKSVNELQSIFQALKEEAEKSQIESPDPAGKSKRNDLPLNDKGQPNDSPKLQTEAGGGSGTKGTHGGGGESKPPVQGEPIPKPKQESESKPDPESLPICITPPANDEPDLDKLIENILKKYLNSLYDGNPSSELDAYHREDSCKQPIRLLSDGLSAGSLAPQLGVSDRPLPPSMYAQVIGTADFFRMAVATSASLAVGAASSETAGYLDVRRLITEEAQRAYDWLEKEGQGAWGRFATPELANAIRTRDFITINRLHREFDHITIANTMRSITATLAWSILVDAALLNEKLIKDMHRVSREKGCTCLNGDYLTFVGPEETLSSEAQGAWKEYVNCRWPIQVFALDPVGEDQNIADQFSRRRELQLALAVGVAQGNVRASIASRFARQLETDIETISLNRVAVGFSHGSDTFGWRFYPRLQTPDTPGTLGAFWETVAGGPDLDADLRERGLEPGIRECTAIVVMPSFIPHATFDSRASWFSLTNPRRKVLTMKDTMKISRNYQAVRRSLNCAHESCAYRPGDVAHLTSVVDQIERRLPLQNMRVPIPFENTLGGFQMFRAGITDLAPELYGWYGAPGIKIASNPTHKTTTETNQTIDKTTIKTVVEAEKSSDPPGTTIFLVGSRFSVHETKVIAGGKPCTPKLLSREIMQVEIPGNVNTVKKTFAGDCVKSGDKKFQDYVDVHIATPYGVTSHMLVKALEKPNAEAIGANEKAIASATTQVQKLDEAVKKIQRSLPSSSADESTLKMTVTPQSNGPLAIRPAFGVLEVTANLVNESGAPENDAPIEMALYDAKSGGYVTSNFGIFETVTFKGKPSGLFPETISQKFNVASLVDKIRSQLTQLATSDFSNNKKELLGVLLIKRSDGSLRTIGEIKLDLTLNSPQTAATNQNDTVVASEFHIRRLPEPRTARRSASSAYR